MESIKIINSFVHFLNIYVHEFIKLRYICDPKIKIANDISLNKFLDRNHSEILKFMDKVTNNLEYFNHVFFQNGKSLFIIWPVQQDCCLNEQHYVNTLEAMCSTVNNEKKNYILCLYCYFDGSDTIYDSTDFAKHLITYNHKRYVCLQSHIVSTDTLVSELYSVGIRSLFQFSHIDETVKTNYERTCLAMFKNIEHITEQLTEFKKYDESEFTFFLLLENIFKSALQNNDSCIENGSQTST